MLTTKEAAKILGVTPQTARNYIIDNKLPAIQIRKGQKLEYRISHIDLMQFKKKYMRLPERIEITRKTPIEVGAVISHEGKNKKVVRIFSTQKSEEWINYELNVVEI